ncbi:transcription termination factor MTERF8, chloroplastic-like [Punica granatum]|uniref:Uncharacterized protein n=2 Tax=Punica granatum TaxID=22663 RepID=A0A218XS08_PUNGR|nr:transcription termination factor MTERF8, chloroplastic-like [Punica granatum]OWM87311.1 hypothetical protein CDL15_Pgr022418 [Punica granatum]PKI33888.1 hypothetical protein CRG98_045718 [Punica granatum]
MAKFRSFSLSSLLFIPRRLFSTSKASSPSHPFTVDYLVSKCGMPLESAISAAKGVQIRETATKNPDAVVSFLKSYGFDDTHLTSLISRRPRLLFSRPQTSLKPKLDFFIENGFRGSLLHELIVRNPGVLKRSVKTHLEPVFNLLRRYILTFEELHTAIRRFGWLLTSQHDAALRPNIEYLLRKGVTPDRVSKFIVYQPRAAVQSHKRLVNAVESVKRIGIEPKAPLFIHALRVMLSMTETNWNHKVEIFKSLGWSEEDVHSTFRKDPSCLGASEEKLRALMDFYLNTAKVDWEMIIKYPKFLTYGLDTRLRRRHRVLETLISKGLLKRDKSNGWIYTVSEKCFLSRYVVKNLDVVPALMEMYQGSSDKEKGAKKKKKQEEKVV